LIEGRTDCNQVLSAAEGNFSDSQGVGLRECLLHDIERLRLYVVLRGDEIRPIENLRGQLTGLHKLFDLHDRGGLQAQCFQLFWIDLNVFVLRVFKTLDDVSLLDFAPFVYVLVMNSLMGLSIDLMKLDLTSGIGGWETLTAIETNEI
jgi:hypothetical protein